MTVGDLIDRLKSYSQSNEVYFRIGNMRYPVLDIFPERVVQKNTATLDSGIREQWKELETQPGTTNP